MKTKSFILITTIVLLSIPYLVGISSVPFHPDESTHLYTSEDVTVFFKNPTRLFWNPSVQDARQTYRLLDAPLSRTVIGLGRTLTSQPAIVSDWNWSKTWAENEAAGALPTRQSLWMSRLFSALFFPFALLCMFFAAQSLIGAKAAWSALLLTALNAYLLLHGRRAMSEGLLFLNITFFAWALFTWKKHPWLLAIPTALAFSAKYSSIPLILIGLISMVWPISQRPWHLRILDSVRFSILSGLIIFILHPIFWSDPLHAIPAALQARQDLIANQVSALAAIQPDQILNTPIERMTALIIQLFLAPLAIADVGNYLAQTQLSANAYLANPLNTLLRSLTGGGILLGLTIIGPLLSSIRQIRQRTLVRPVLLSGMALVLQTAFLVTTVPLPFQRYAMPLLPWCILFQSLAIEQLIERFLPQKQKQPLN